jgi:hypothetical protein
MSFAIVFRAEEIFIQIVIIYNWYMFLLCVGKCFTDSALCALFGWGGQKVSLKFPYVPKISLLCTAKNFENY